MREDNVYKTRLGRSRVLKFKGDVREHWFNISRAIYILVEGRRVEVDLQGIRSAKPKEGVANPSAIFPAINRLVGGPRAEVDHAREFARVRMEQ